MPWKRADMDLSALLGQVEGERRHGSGGASLQQAWRERRCGGWLHLFNRTKAYVETKDTVQTLTGGLTGDLVLEIRVDDKSER
jgi:hypothetical protein